MPYVVRTTSYCFNSTGLRERLGPQWIRTLTGVVILVSISDFHLCDSSAHRTRANIEMGILLQERKRGNNQGGPHVSVGGRVADDGRNRRKGLAETHGVCEVSVQ